MKSTFRFITLLLCLELIVGPVSPNLSLLVETVRADQSCPTGMQFDSNLNRCLTKDETARVMNATASCNGDADCIKRNALQEFDQKVSAGEAPGLKSSSGFMSTIGNAAAVAGPLAVAVGATSTATSTCASASFWTMVAGSAAFVIGDNWANYQHRSRLAKIKEDWGKIVNPTDANGDKDKIRQASNTAQGQAFEMLAKAEDSLAQAANFKKMTYMIAGLAFTASAVISGLEIIADDTTNTSRLANICRPAAASMSAPEGGSPTGSPATKIYAVGTPQNNWESRTPVSGTNATTMLMPAEAGLFEYYINGDRSPVFAHRFTSNIENSTDFASLFVNRYAMTLSHSSPTLEYYAEMKSEFREFEVENQDYFDLFKAFTLTVMTNVSPIPSAHAEEKKSNSVDTNAAQVFRQHEGKGIDFIGIGVGAVAGAAAGMFAANYITPITRTIFAGLMAGMSLVMMSHAGSQAEASKKRAALLRKMKSEFESASGAISTCKSEDRSDPGKPECYCYTADNQRNSARNNSTVCKNLWAGKNLTETNYLAKPANNAKICINNQNKADVACSCRKTNTCMKVSAGGLTGVGAGTMSMLNSSLQPLNEVANGSTSAGNVNSGALASQAARLEALKKKVEAHPALANLRKNKNKATADLENRLRQASGSLGVSGSGLLGNNSSNMPSNAGEAARALERELEEPTSPNAVSGNTQAVGGGAGRPQPENLEFGISAEDAALQSNQVAAAMNQNLDYSANGSDINSSSASIFEVLTIRYQRSGMRRLFEEPTTASPAAAGAPATRPAGP